MMKEKKMFDAAEILGTGAVDGSRFAAWYREFDAERFKQLFVEAVEAGVPYAYVGETRVGGVVNSKGRRIGGELVPFVSLNKHDDFRRCADLRDPMQVGQFAEYCKRHPHYLEVLKGNN